MALFSDFAEVTDCRFNCLVPTLFFAAGICCIGAAAECDKRARLETTFAKAIFGRSRLGSLASIGPWLSASLPAGSRLTPLMLVQGGPWVNAEGAFTGDGSMVAREVELE